jgi:hypothetical protein
MAKSKPGRAIVKDGEGVLILANIRGDYKALMAAINDAHNFEIGSRGIEITSTVTLGDIIGEGDDSEKCLRFVIDSGIRATIGKREAATHGGSLSNRYQTQSISREDVMRMRLDVVKGTRWAGYMPFIEGLPEYIPVEYISQERKKSNLARIIYGILPNYYTSNGNGRDINKAKYEEAEKIFTGLKDKTTITFNALPSVMIKNDEGGIDHYLDPDEVGREHKSLVSIGSVSCFDEKPIAQYAILTSEGVYLRSVLFKRKRLWIF